MPNARLLPALLAAGALAAAQPPAPFAWPGTYDIVGHGFGYETRRASLTVQKVDTGYTYVMRGPPGRMESVRLAGDSLHVAWALGDPDGATELMHVRLRGAGDSLTGVWSIGEQSGVIVGRRRPATPTVAPAP